MPNWCCQNIFTYKREWFLILNHQFIGGISLKIQLTDISMINLLWNTPQSIIIKPETFPGFFSEIPLVQNPMVGSYLVCNLNWTLYLWDFYIFRCLYQLLKSYFVHNEDNSNFSSLPIRRVSELNYSWISFWTDFKSQKWSWWQSDLTATVKEFGRNLSIHNDDSNEFELTKEPSRKPMLLSLM